MNKIPKDRVVSYNFAAMKEEKNFYSYFAPGNPGEADVNSKSLNKLIGVKPVQVDVVGKKIDNVLPSNLERLDLIKMDI